MHSSCVDALQIRQAAQIDSSDVPAVCDQQDSSRVLQLISHLAFAIGGIQKGGDGAGELGGMKGGAEFPGVAQEDGDDVSRLDARGNQSAPQIFDSFSILRKAEPSAAGVINDSSLLGIPAARVEYEAVKKQILWVGVESRAQHAGREL